MRRDTGAGKVQAAFGGGADQFRGVAAVLYNFDFDDFDENMSDLKYEHTHWLDTYAIPLLQLGSNWKISITGSASRIGDAGYNQQLSQTRADRVLGYVFSQPGIDVSEIGDFNATGSQLAILLNDAPDDEHDRAVILMVEEKDFDAANPGDDPPLLDYLASLWKSDPLNTST